MESTLLLEQVLAKAESMSRYSLTRLAHEDLDAIWDYLAIESDNPSAAEGQLRRIHEALTMFGARDMDAILRNR